MAGKRKMCYSGIGGQAVLEGVMMKNKELYAVAVRKPDGDIDVEVQEYHGVMHGSKLTKIPFIRGVFNFIDSLILGVRTLDHSASFYEDEDAKDTKADEVLKENSQKTFSVLTILFSVVLAVGLFVLLPYYLSTLLKTYVRNASLLAIFEGGIRLLIFLLYITAIGFLKDIKRLYRYHGAEHKCINCLERGHTLDVDNVKRSSRFHRRCGTSFLLLVMLVSIVLFMFITVENPWLKILLRLLLIPVIAGISYELIRLAGSSNNILVRIISAPGLLLQRLTTREPDEEMIEVAIKSVEAVFDWKAFLKENFDYEDY